ncbi:MAG: serine/threonine protein kinase [Alistipes sp.]|nr:serine/threonine protein kinase [Alistipes sp.]
MEFSKEITNTYEIIEQLGQGGGGVVYKAMHKRLKKFVVMKNIRGGISNIEDCRTEVDILKNLKNTHLPEVIDFIQSPEGVFTVMEYIPGKSLEQILKEGHLFCEAEIIEYARQLSDAIAYLHNHEPSVIHGDIKPQNVMITPDGKLYLIDFLRINKRKTGILPDKRSDVYSAGEILNMMSAGNDQLSDKLRKIIEKAYNADPKKRYRDGGELFNAIDKFQHPDQRLKNICITVLHAFLTVGMTILIFGISLISIAKTSFSEKEIYKSLCDTEITEMNLEILYGEEKTFIDVVFYGLDSAMYNYVEKRKLKNVIEDERIKEIFANKLYLYVDDLFNNTQRGRISVQDVDHIVDLIAELFVSEVGYTMNEADIKQLKGMYNVAENADLSVIKERNPKTFYALCLMMSDTTLLVETVLCIIMGILIFLIRANTISVFRTMGISFTINGVILLLLVILKNIVIFALDTSLKFGKDFFETFLASLFRNAAITGGILFTVGTILFIICFIKEIRKTFHTKSFEET